MICPWSAHDLFELFLSRAAHAVAKKRQKMYALYPSDGNNMLTIRDCFFYFYVMIPHREYDPPRVM